MLLWAALDFVDTKKLRTSSCLLLVVITILEMMLINLSRMKVPHRWFLTFGSSNKGHDYPFRTKVTDLHLHGTMRRIGCRVRVQSKSALQWALHIRCDIARTYLFRCLCISQVLHHNYRRVIILGWCHGSCSLFRCEGCGTRAQRT